MPSGPAGSELLQAAERLHGYLRRHHYQSGVLRGPDAGVRFNLRLWRFLKSALGGIPWRDDYVFIQTEGYWILSNWMLFDATGDPSYRDLAIETAKAVLALERSDGAWAYPLPERRHLIATVEGNWGAIGLVASYARESRPEFLDGALRWYDFLVQRIGFEEHTSGKAINYFDKPRGKVPNNSVEATWLFLRLWKATGDGRFREHVGGMLDFLAAVQRPSGELPYVVESPYEKAREHYLCFQYNAFQFLKLAWSARLDPGSAAGPIAGRLACFLERGVTAEGASAADCRHRLPEVDYYTAVLAAALHEAARMRVEGAASLSARCYRRLLARQKPDGGFGYSTGDYAVLRDQRSYPRPLAMTLFHLLCGADLGASGDTV